MVFSSVTMREVYISFETFPLWLKCLNLASLCALSSLNIHYFFHEIYFPFYFIVPFSFSYFTFPRPPFHIFPLLMASANITPPPPCGIWALFQYIQKSKSDSALRHPMLAACLLFCSFHILVQVAEQQVLILRENQTENVVRNLCCCRPEIITVGILNM